MQNKKTKHIIALSTSPSRGRNSDTMLDAFLEGAKKISGIEIEKIYLDTIPIDYYKYDNKNGPQPHETEFKNLADNIQGSDGLVIAAPTYNYSVPAHLKNFVKNKKVVERLFEREHAKTCTFL